MYKHNTLRAKTWTKVLFSKKNYLSFTLNAKINFFCQREKIKVAEAGDTWKKEKFQNPKKDFFTSC